MSYIIEKNSPLILTKLTNIGRKKLAQGNLTFDFWALGDSEIDYRYLDNIPEDLGEEKILRPKDMQPPIKTFLQKDDCVKLHNLTLADKSVVECCIRNQAIQRGFFSGNTLESNEIITNDKYVRTTGVIKLSQLSGSKIIKINTIDYNDGDFILFKIAKPETGAIDINDTSKPILYLWYKITKTPSSTIVELDRKLPYFSLFSAIDDVNVNFIIYPNNNPITTFYGSGSTKPYWNSETLEFTSSCDITNEDVAVLNQNNVWNEDLAGIIDGYESHYDFGSIDFVGQKEYLGYNNDCPTVFEVGGDCEDKFLSTIDEFVKGIGIIHYTNFNISNEYGELFYINHNEGYELELLIPTIMWHRRDFGGSGLGDELGMRFISSGSLKKVENSEITYYDLIEDINYIASSGTPIAVGRVFPTLKIVTIDNEELLATMSYKSNRNYSLPMLKGNLIFPTDGVNTGFLPKNKTLYLTYTFESTSGQKYILPQQKYAKFVNLSKIGRDIDFVFENIGLLPYMRKLEVVSYDGLGFYANQLKVIGQIVDNSSDRPDPNNWRVMDFSTNAIQEVAGQTINPIKLENQVATNNNFIINATKWNNGVQFNLSNLGIAEDGCPEVLQFGDEQVFYGNLNTWIGACIYKSVFNILLTGKDFKKTDNVTWSNGDTLSFNEIGIYDADQELVAITKMSRHINLNSESTFALEITLDF